MKTTCTNHPPTVYIETYLGRDGKRHCPACEASLPPRKDWGKTRCTMCDKEIKKRMWNHKYCDNCNPSK